MLNSITEIHRKGLFRRQASGLLSQEGDRVGHDLVAGIELNAIARVGQDLDHKAFELDEFFFGHFLSLRVAVLTAARVGVVARPDVTMQESGGGNPVWTLPQLFVSILLARRLATTPLLPFGR